MQRTKAWLLLVFGLDGDRMAIVPTEGSSRSRSDGPAVCPLALVLTLLIRLIMALALVLGLIMRILEML